MTTGKQKELLEEHLRLSTGPVSRLSDRKE